MTLARREYAFSKLMIAGEYAVLFGSPALVAAVNRKAVCTFFHEEKWEFIADMGGVVKSILDHPLFVASFKEIDAHGLSLPRGKYVLDTSAFFSDRGQKLGLGSSAAAIIALCKMAWPKNLFEPELLFKIACLAQRHIFGQGSGADIAASLYGGALLFRKSDTLPFIEKENLPLWKNFVFVDVKKPQSTQNFVDAVLRLKNRDQAFVKDFCKSSEYALEELRRSFDISSSIKAFDLIYSQLFLLGKYAQIDIISDEHARVFSVAKNYGGSAKPSGAGGGDIAIALIPEEHQNNFKQEIKKDGFMTIDLAVAPQNFLS